MGSPNSIEAKLIRWILGDTTTLFPTPAGAYGMLFTTLPNDAGSGGVEVSAGGYSRLNLSGKFGTLSSITSGDSVANTVQCLWGPATANWGTILGVGIIDAASGGGTVGLLRVTALDAGVPINSGGKFYLDPGDWVLRQD